MTINLMVYKTMIFDCDGVILNSNKIKTEAFYETTKVFGHDYAQTLVDYHLKNGGISRYAKFEYFFHKILNQQVDEFTLNTLLLQFAETVKQRLATCEVAEGLADLKYQNKDAKWLIVSGGDQTELREVFATKNLAQFFDGGIFGSPDTKECILQAQLNENGIILPALFLGDSKYDYQVATKANFDFIFLTEWTEVKDWQEWVLKNNIKYKKNISEMLVTQTR